MKAYGAFTLAKGFRCKVLIEARQEPDHFCARFLLENRDSSGQSDIAALHSARRTFSPDLETLAWR